MKDPTTGPEWPPAPHGALEIASSCNGWVVHAPLRPKDNEGVRMAWIFNDKTDLLSFIDDYLEGRIEGQAEPAPSPSA